LYVDFVDELYFKVNVLVDDVKFCLDALSERLKEIRILYDLEHKCMSGIRLDTRSGVTLNNLRTLYPGSAQRIRDEINMGEVDDQRIIEFVSLCEDRPQIVATPTFGGASTPKGQSNRLRLPEEDDVDDLSL